MIHSSRNLRNVRDKINCKNDFFNKNKVIKCVYFMQENESLTLFLT